MIWRGGRGKDGQESLDHDLRQREDRRRTMIISRAREAKRGSLGGG